MEETVVRCLSGDELQYFLSLIGPIWEWMSDKVLVIHASAGDVIWSWNEGTEKFCHDMHDLESS
jgi:hypothetical protein